MIERRDEARRSARTLRIALATLRPGCTVEILDASPSGARIITDRQLRPGSRVHVRLVTERCTVAVAAHVLRCTVSAIDPDRGVSYTGALRFEERCPRLGDAECDTGIVHADRRS